MRLRIVLVLAAFAAALALRLIDAPLVFTHDAPQISPLDELYHLKRMTYSAEHFPRVLELDRDRGIGGAFCPWPPLYDLTAGGIARATGATSQDDVLRRVVWIPPFAFALFVAATVAWIERRFGLASAIAAGLALAASPFIVEQSSIGSIDHHWLEPMFVVAMLAAISPSPGLRPRSPGSAGRGLTVPVSSEGRECTVARERRMRGILAIALALTAALFVQTALLIAAALVFVILFFTDAAAGALAFGIGAVAIALYRVTRAAGYPDNQWFLGWTHVALFAAACVACAYLSCGTGFQPVLRRHRLEASATRKRLFFGALAFGFGAVAIALYRVTRAAGYPDNQWFLGWTHVALFAAACVACAYLSCGTGLQPVLGGHRLEACATRKRSFALLAGAAAVLAIPSAPSSLLGGATFFGGEPWLRTIAEFQPLWRARPDDLLAIVIGLGAGAILVFFLAARAIRERDQLRITLALFAMVYLLLTISSRRFWSVGIPLLAIAGAVQAAEIERRWLRIVALAAVAVVPPLQFAGWQLRPSSIVTGAQQQWIDAARFLQSQPPGRVLAPWWYGHTIDVDGHRATVVDNFGTMPDEIVFDRAQDAMLTTHDDTLARYCRDNGIRYVMLVHPAPGLASARATLGLDESPYVNGTTLTKLGRATWWARAWSGATTQHFRRIAPFIWEVR